MQKGDDRVGNGAKYELKIGSWSLFTHRKSIVGNDLEKFNGEPVAESMKIDGEVTESEDDAGTQ